MDAKLKRKRVMARSIKLGHCVCDPRKPCPCPLFREKNVCTCAGERVPIEIEAKATRLTEHVRSAGCASKIGQKDLHQVLSLLPMIEDKRLLVGAATADDAGVFQLTPDVILVQTVDVFTPGVDDPYLFGRIAGCNSLSDVYAMGGTPVTALSIIGFPIYELPYESMAEILRGGMDVLKEADTILLGGHSINDEEIKYGYAVTGTVERERLVTNAGAKSGNTLILTKPLGTGIIALAHQIGRAAPESIAACSKAMSTLNRKAAEIMGRHRATACTDITCFGLLGHLSNIVAQSHVTAEIWFERLPLFPNVMEYAKQGIYSGANERNAEYSLAHTSFADDVSEEMRAVLFDAQTSGGLIIALPDEEVDDVVREMRDAGVDPVAIVGRITERSEGKIHITASAPKNPVSAKRSATRAEATMSKAEETSEETCCEHGSSTPDKAGGMFEDFMGTAMQPGAVDVVTKELLAIALSLAQHCEPCARIHLKKAKTMDIGLEELEEVAALATAFSGCRVHMWWKELKKEFF
jgi:selenide, water dikinase